MLNTLQNSLESLPFPTEEEKSFKVIIPYPKIETDPFFHQVMEMIDFSSGSIGDMIAEYLVLGPDIRLDKDRLEYTLIDSLISSATSLIDNIETEFVPELGDYIPLDLNDRQAYYSAMEIVWGGLDTPLCAYNIVQRIIPLFNEYYGHIFLPDEMDIFNDWIVDMDKHEQDYAVIVFKDPTCISHLEQFLQIF